MQYAEVRSQNLAESSTFKSLYAFSWAVYLCHQELMTIASVQLWAVLNTKSVTETARYHLSIVSCPDYFSRKMQSGNWSHTQLT